MSKYELYLNQVFHRNGSNFSHVDRFKVLTWADTCVKLSDTFKAIFPHGTFVPLAEKKDVVYILPSSDLWETLFP